jgi:hypothetical protein
MSIVFYVGTMLEHHIPHTTSVDQRAGISKVILDELTRGKFGGII